VSYYAACTCGWTSERSEGPQRAKIEAEAHEDEFPQVEETGPLHVVRIVQFFGGNWLRGGH